MNVSSQQAGDAALHRLVGGDYRGEQIGKVSLSEEGLVYLDHLSMDEKAHGLDRCNAETFVAFEPVKAELVRIREAARLAALADTVELPAVGS